MAIAAGYWRPWLFLPTLLGVVSLQAAANMINDHYDYLAGVDSFPPLSKFSGGSGVLPRHEMTPAEVGRLQGYVDGNRIYDGCRRIAGYTDGSMIYDASYNPMAYVDDSNVYLMDGTPIGSHYNNRLFDMDGNYIGYGNQGFRGLLGTILLLLLLRRFFRRRRRFI
jgi:hypothetical protein